VGLVLGALLLLGTATGGDASTQGWRYVADKLVADGIERARVDRVYRRLPRFTPVGFSPAPRESPARYRKLVSGQSVAAARRCRQRHDRWFRKAEARFGVPASVLSAILHVESSCGGYTGRDVVLHRLSRLAMANEPANVRYNVQRWTREVAAPRRAEIERRVRERGAYLEATFYPEVRATFELAAKLRIDPLGIRGSTSGAFGLPQFLPTSYLRFGLDANDNGTVSLFEPPDAIDSAANYLAGHGWRRGADHAEQRRALWAYNRSDAYIDTILTLAARIK
jgi:membrane-bound lytic murein transglycosylase B